jgi:DNA-binding GntR family transcriptional regulator
MVIERKSRSAGQSVKSATDSWALPPQRSLPEIVAERLVEAIRAGTLKPGERLVETTLASKLQVSRGPLREALKALEANHLVESRRGRGTCVREVTSAEVAQMIAVRALLEGLAARLVATNATPSMIERLQRLHRRIEIAARSGETSEWRDLDWSFHELICVLSGNAFLLASWRSISNLIRIFLHQHSAYLNNVEGVLGNHATYIDAISKRDADRAESVFRTTILQSGFGGLGVDVPLSLEVYVDRNFRVAGSLSGAPAKGRKSDGKERRVRSHA